MRSTILLVVLAAVAGCGGSRTHQTPAPDGPEPSSPYSEEHLRGAADARARIEAGSYVLLVPSAVPVAWMHRIRVEEYGRYGIEYELTGDHYDPSFEAYRAGFNSVMEDAVKRRHGEDVFERIRAAIDHRLRTEAPDSAAVAGPRISSSPRGGRVQAPATSACLPSCSDAYRGGA